MHGTYRIGGEHGPGFPVHVSTPGRALRASWQRALQLGTCLAVGAGAALVPNSSNPPRRPLALEVVSVPAPTARQPLAAARVQRVDRAAVAAPTATLLTPAATPPEVPVAELVAPFVSADPVSPAPPLIALPLAPVESGSAALRKVDIAQLTDRAGEPLAVPQLLEPGLVAGAPPALVAKVDAMQVALPASMQLNEEDRAVLLAEAPAEMTVRMGEDSIGSVAYRMSEIGTIDVQLAGLLDLVADQMAPAEYSRLRKSAAADTYVPLDQLRAIGLSVRYDAVYDELDLSA